MLASTSSSAFVVIVLPCNDAALTFLSCGAIKELVSSLLVSLDEELLVLVFASAGLLASAGVSSLKNELSP